MIIDIKKLCSPPLKAAAGMLKLLPLVINSESVQEEPETFVALKRLDTYLKLCVASGMDPIVIPGRHRIIFLSVLATVNQDLRPAIDAMIKSGLIGEEDY